LATAAFADEKSPDFVRGKVYFSQGIAFGKPVRIGCFIEINGEVDTKSFKIPEDRPGSHAEVFGKSFCCRMLASVQHAQNADHSIEAF
jgi:hypothetical protein